MERNEHGRLTYGRLEQLSPLDRRNLDLFARSKELYLLHKLCGLALRAGSPAEDTLRAATDLILNNWDYGKCEGVKITYFGREFRSPVFQESGTRFSANINYGDLKFGRLEVFVREDEMAGSDCSNSSHLISDIGGILGAILKIAGSSVPGFRAGPEHASARSNYQSIFDEMKDGMAITDDSGDILYCNESLSRISGKSTIGLLNAPIFSFVNALNLKELQTAVQNPGREAHTFRICLNNPAGQSREVEITTVPFPNESKIAWLFRDFSELENLRNLIISKEAALTELKKQLEEANTALRVIAKQRDDDTKEFEDKIKSNIRSFIRPQLEKLKGTNLNEVQKYYLSSMESHLNEIISPFVSKMSSSFFKLTPTEIQIAGLIRDGRKTKEIAEVLNLSASTILFHRNNLRRKLKLKNRKINLMTYLSYLEK